MSAEFFITTVAEKSYLRWFEKLSLVAGEKTIVGGLKKSRHSERSEEPPN